MSKPNDFQRMAGRVRLWLLVICLLLPFNLWIAVAAAPLGEQKIEIKSTGFPGLPLSLQGGFGVFILLRRRRD